LGLDPSEEGGGKKRDGLNGNKPREEEKKWGKKTHLSKREGESCD